MVTSAEEAHYIRECISRSHTYVVSMATIYAELYAANKISFLFELQ